MEEMENGKWNMTTPAAAMTFAICLFPFSILPGCSDNAKKPATRPTSVEERQEAALHDPFGYSPYGETNDISGGDLGEFDKDAMKKDLDHVLNP